MTIAQEYPPQIDANGLVWYRPRFEGRKPPSDQWGWTATPSQAHESYSASDCPPAQCMLCGVRTFDEHCCGNTDGPVWQAHLKATRGEK